MIGYLDDLLSDCEHAVLSSLTGVTDEEHRAAAPKAYVR